MVTRGKAKAGRVEKTTIEIRSSVVEEGEDSQQATPGFEAASTVTCKRKAENSVNDKLTAMAATITQLVMAQKHTAESLEAFLESYETILDRNKALLENTQAMM
jgi:hypothetical protein